MTYDVEKHGVGEQTAIHEAEPDRLVKRRTVDSILHGVVQESAPCYRFDESSRNETRLAVVDWVFVTMEQYKSGIERLAKKILELLHGDKLYTEAFRKKLKSVISCGKLVKSTSGMLMNQKYMKT